MLGSAGPPASQLRCRCDSLMGAAPPVGSIITLPMPLALCQTHSTSWGACPSLLARTWPIPATLPQHRICPGGSKGNIEDSRATTDILLTPEVKQGINVTHMRMYKLVNRCQLLPLGCISNEILLYSPGNYQSMMEGNVRRRMYICTCDWVTLLYGSKSTERCNGKNKNHF